MPWRLSAPRHKISAGFIERTFVAEYCEQLKEVEESLTHIRRFSKGARLVFKALFVLNLIGLIVLVAVYLLVEGNAIEGVSPVSAKLPLMMPPVMFLLVTLSIVWFLEGIFEDIVRGDSPFTRKQAKRLNYIALLLLAMAIIDLAVQVLFVDYSSVVQFNPDLEVGYIAPQERGRFHIDAKALFAAVVCHCFSKLFSYGACIQDVSNETV